MGEVAVVVVDKMVETVHVDDDEEPRLADGVDAVGATWRDGGLCGCRQSHAGEVVWARERRRWDRGLRHGAENKAGMLQKR